MCLNVSIALGLIPLRRHAETVSTNQVKNVPNMLQLLPHRIPMRIPSSSKSNPGARQPSNSKNLPSETICTLTKGVLLGHPQAPPPLNPLDPPLVLPPRCPLRPVHPLPPRIRPTPVSPQRRQVALEQLHQLLPRELLRQVAFLRQVASSLLFSVSPLCFKGKPSPHPLAMGNDGSDAAWVV